MPEICREIGKSYPDQEFLILEGSGIPDDRVNPPSSSATWNYPICSATSPDWQALRSELEGQPTGS